LANYLANYDGSLILVSHDLALLEKSVTNIAEVVGNTVIAYGSCNYSRYLEEKAFRAKTAQAEYERNMEEATRLQAFVDRFGASATKAASAQSRVKMLEKMKKEGKLEKPPIAIVASHWKPVLKLPPPIKPMGESLLSLKGVSIGYDPLETPLLNNINLDITRGMKILLRGKNGAGKSSLMAVLRGKLSALNGKITQNAKLRLGMFTQDLAQELGTTTKKNQLNLPIRANTTDCPPFFVFHVH
jgi:ATP-binding cassette subfamily F protein 3